MIDEIDFDYSVESDRNILRIENDQESPHEVVNLLRTISNPTTHDEIVVLHMSNLKRSTYENGNDADENYNLRTKRLKETTKLLRSISNPGLTSLPYTIKGRCNYYDMEPRNRQFVSRMLVVVTTFIMFVLTIIILYYIWTENRNHK